MTSDEGHTISNYDLNFQSARTGSFREVSDFPRKVPPFEGNFVLLEDIHAVKHILTITIIN